ncbi:UNVERIFIED_CONTAM: putative amidohydrolase YtcJ [Brevibacillus sp. OAP136]
MVTRQNPYIEYPGAVNASEALDVVQAIELFTINGARSMYLDNVTGSIQVGKSADMIVLDRNPLSIPPTDIRNTKVLCTILEGKTVYEAGVVYGET